MYDLEKMKVLKTRTAMLNKECENFHRYNDRMKDGMNILKI